MIWISLYSLFRAHHTAPPPYPWRGPRNARGMFVHCVGTTVWNNTMQTTKPQFWWQACGLPEDAHVTGAGRVGRQTTATTAH